MDTLIASEKIQACTMCRLCKTMPLAPVPGKGSVTADILIVGEYSTSDDAVLEEPFSGLPGKMMKKILNQANVPEHRVYFTNLLKCTPKKGDKVENEMVTCRSLLLDEAYEIKPKYIIACGQAVSYHLLFPLLKRNHRIADSVGQRFDRHGMGNKSIIIPIYSPSYIMQSGVRIVNETVEIFKNI